MASIYDIYKFRIICNCFKLRRLYLLPHSQVLFSSTHNVRKLFAFNGDFFTGQEVSNKHSTVAFDALHNTFQEEFPNVIHSSSGISFPTTPKLQTIFFGKEALLSSQYGVPSMHIMFAPCVHNALIRVQCSLLQDLFCDIDNSLGLRHVHVALQP